MATRLSSVAFEIAGDRLRRIADFPKIKSLASHCEEKHTIKFLEQNGRGLVDGAEDGLAVVGELSEKCTDGPGGLAI